MPMRIEAHHIIPRAWQRVWRPVASLSDVLWDERTIDLCPTSHVNVHVLLVAMMKNYEGQTRGINERDKLRLAWLETQRQHGSDRALEVALDAPRRWLDHGGSLDDLVEMKQYGYGLRLER